MLFNQMRDKAAGKDAGWKYGNWSRIFYDEPANLCYVGYKKYDWTRNREVIGYTTLQEAYVIFRPDNVLMINRKDIDADFFMLRALTINGKINRGPNFRSRYRYTHDLQHEYEVIPYMEISMKTSKPLKARLLEKVPVDQDRLLVIREGIKRMRAATQALIRIDENKILSSGGQKSSEIRARHDENAVKIAEIIETFIDKDHAMNGHWAKTTLRLMSAHWQHSDHAHPIRRFDSMIRFHDAAVFRHLGVTR